MARLIIHDTEGVQEIDLVDRNSIGRLSRNRIRIADDLVSKEHCLIYLDPRGGYGIKDLGSQNGTFVNGHRIVRETPLSDRDVVTIGRTSCIFLAGDLPHGTSDGMEATIQFMDADRSWSQIAQDRFLPEEEIWDEKVLRADYEKLRIAHELQREIGLELNLDRIFNRILDRTFQLLNCDRAVILMVGENGGMEVRASKTRHSGEDLVVSSTLVNFVREHKVGLICGDALADERFSCAESICNRNIRSSMAVPIVYEQELLGVMIIDSSASVRAYAEKDLLLFNNIAHQTSQFTMMAKMAKRIEEEALTRERFQRLMSPDLAEMVVSGSIKVEKGGQNRVATILFADIRGFTSMCENMRAAEVLIMLNEFFELMVDVGFRHEGTVANFIGDMIMLVWGAPVFHPDDPVRAVQAAVEMQEVLAEYNRGRREKGLPEIGVGIGINTGDLMAGYLGSTRTMTYSVIGDPVNVASRLCALARQNQILISEHSRLSVDNHFETAEISTVKVKGRKAPIRIYEVVGRKRN
ncbi:adenylate/guanylate cyclase domain-containing protein [Syntrophobacter fumaroxidans]|uniref:Adenylate/guanylate cyclase n=1 Tax=Syntrophobacter fumaroxidans (strain DSM 10017 / MPOB) TaxID=335543 RepID=A0LFQ6_SYNFM|nr:adenylate/guanylate cyclase domain-containing protein [Syntrophobacter fumaroxidans]ABK16258.1 adenylate/guanylate cyclase [Syntrophobacter fumaroxidans MPOB]